jgi:hypothetical protein
VTFLRANLTPLFASTSFCNSFKLNYYKILNLLQIKLRKHTFISWSSFNRDRRGIKLNCSIVSIQLTWRLRIILVREGASLNSFNYSTIKSALRMRVYIFLWRSTHVNAILTTWRLIRNQILLISVSSMMILWIRHNLRIS